MKIKSSSFIPQKHSISIFVQKPFFSRPSLSLISKFSSNYSTEVVASSGVQYAQEESTTDSLSYKASSILYLQKIRTTSNTQRAGGIKEKYGSNRCSLTKAQSSFLASALLIPDVGETLIPIFGYTVSGMAKLLVILWAIGVLIRGEIISRDTGPVLSRLAYNLLIPCMLFYNISQLLSNNRSLLFFGITLGSLLQITFGCFIGWIYSKIIDRGIYYFKTDPSYKALKPDSSAKEIAIAAATAMGNPRLAPVLIQRPTLPPNGLSAMIAIACGFGNSITLPTLLLTSLIPATSFEFATSALAFFLIAWSPLFFSIGSTVLRRSLNTRITVISNEQVRQEIPVHGSPLPVRLKDIISPPVVAIISAIFFSLSPLGPIIFSKIGNAYSPIDIWEAALLYILKTCKESIVLMASGLMCIQIIILAVSIFQKEITSDVFAKRRNGIISLLFPSDPIERRAMILVSTARFILVPIFTLTAVKLLSLYGLLPKNTIAHLAILVQSAMPPAQNLALLLNLEDSTRPLVPLCGRFLLMLYIWSIIPVTLWTAYFAALCKGPFFG